MTETNRGPWIVTKSGVQFYLADPHEDDVRIEDIAAGLSRICRFGGQLSDRHKDDIYSVAQHSVYVDRLLSMSGHQRARKWGLLHDATEAFYGDMISPLKSLFPAYSLLEDRAAARIRTALGVKYDGHIAMEVHWADKTMGMMESAVLSDHHDKMWSGEYAGLSMGVVDEDFRIWSPAEAHDRFMEAFAELS